MIGIPTDRAAGILGGVYGLATGVVGRLSRGVSSNLEQSMLAIVYVLRGKSTTDRRHVTYLSTFRSVCHR